MWQEAPAGQRAAGIAPRRLSALPSRAWLLEQTAEQAARVWAERRRPPSLAEVADRVGYSRSGLMKAFAREGIAWGGLKFESRRLNREHQ